MLHQAVTQPRSRCKATVLFALSLFILQRQTARADAEEMRSPLSLQLQLDAGMGMFSSSLPGVNGTRRVEPAWFPVAGVRILGLQAFGRPLRFGAELSYLSSTAFDVTRSIAPDAIEQGNARAQELNLLGRVAIALDQRAHPMLLPISLGYGFDAFTTNVPLTGAQTYLLSGPRMALGIELPLWAERVNLAARAELGANLTDTAALRNSGVSAFGVQYAWQAEADVQLSEVLRLGLRVRQADVQLPIAGSSSFHEQRRFVLACLMLRNAR
jgi:hypothetical protein